MDKKERKHVFVEQRTYVCHFSNTYESGNIYRKGIILRSVSWNIPSILAIY